MVREGAVVVAHAERSETAVGELHDEFPEHMVAIAANLGGPAERCAFFAAAAQATGRVDVLIKKPGRGWAPPWTIPKPGAQRLGTQPELLNLQAPVDLFREAIAHFREQGGGAITNATSRSAHRGDDEERLAYGAS